MLFPLPSPNPLVIACAYPRFRYHIPECLPANFQNHRPIPTFEVTWKQISEPPYISHRMFTIDSSSLEYNGFRLVSSLRVFLIFTPGILTWSHFGKKMKFVLRWLLMCLWRFLNVSLVSPLTYIFFFLIAWVNLYLYKYYRAIELYFVNNSDSQLRSRVILGDCKK